MQTLSVTIIVKNEQETLPRLLQTVTFADQIVVVDTGSCDNTVEIAKTYTANVFHFDWCDDFSAARNFAIKKANCQYIMWLDADDIVPPASVHKIKRWKISDNNPDTIMCKYCTSFDSQGKPTFWFFRERILRRCAGCSFQGAVHETITPFGNVFYSDIEVHHYKCVRIPTETLTFTLN